MISNGLGRMRDFGTLSGSQRKDGLFSLPAMALGPMKGTAASNLACPHGVKGGRVFSSIPVTMGTPPTLSSGYCIQTPPRSCDMAGVAVGVAARALVIPEGWLVCANNIREKAATAPRAASEPASRRPSCFHLEEQEQEERWSGDCFSGKAVRRFMGLFLSVFFLLVI